MLSATEETCHCISEGDRQFSLHYIDGDDDDDDDGDHDNDDDV